MKRKTYRSLDNPSSFFGIKGRFMSWMVGILGIVAFLAIVVGSLTNSIGGYLTLGIGAVSGYFYVLSLQAKSSAREFSKKLNAKRYPKYYHFPSTPLRHTWRGDRKFLNQK